MTVRKSDTLDSHRPPPYVTAVVAPTSWNTSTMAELYLSQGHKARAIGVYRDIIGAEPNNIHAQERLAVLEGRRRSTKGNSMSFRECLDKIAQSTPDVLSVTIMDYSGIDIDTVNAPDSTCDMQSLMAEFVGPARQLQEVVERLDSPGTFGDLCTRSSGLTCLMKPLTKEYFLAAILGPGAILGKVRFQMRLVSSELQSELV